MEEKTIKMITEPYEKMISNLRQQVEQLSKDNFNIIANSIPRIQLKNILKELFDNLLLKGFIDKESYSFLIKRIDDLWKVKENE